MLRSYSLEPFDPRGNYGPNGPTDDQMRAYGRASLLFDQHDPLASPATIESFTNTVRAIATQLASPDLLEGDESMLGNWLLPSSKGGRSYVRVQYSRNLAGDAELRLGTRNQGCEIDEPYDAYEVVMGGAQKYIVRPEIPVARYAIRDLIVLSNDRDLVVTRFRELTSLSRYLNRQNHGQVVALASKPVTERELVGVVEIMHASVALDDQTRAPADQSVPQDPR